MARVRDVVSSKGTQVSTIDMNASVLDAAALMNSHRIGALVVMDGGKIAGILSERDLMIRVMVPRKDPAATKVKDVMTTQVRVCSMETPIEECSAAMTHHKIRHVPIVDEKGTLVGIISTGDIMAQQFAAQEETIKFLHDYMHGPN